MSFRDYTKGDYHANIGLQFGGIDSQSKGLGSYYDKGWYVG